MKTIDEIKSKLKQMKKLDGEVDSLAKKLCQSCKKYRTCSAVLYRLCVYDNPPNDRFFGKR